MIVTEIQEYTTFYEQVKKSKPLGLRGIARNTILNMLSLETKFSYVDELFCRPRIQFLYIHHVFEDEMENFEKLLNKLSIHHSFISYSEAVNRISTNTIDKPYISISSDDGFKNNLGASRILDKYNIKACFFINPDTIGLNNFSKVKDFCSERLNFPPTEFMNWSDIDDLLNRGHEIGSHTMHHINVAKTNMITLKNNLEKSYEIIKQRCGDVKHFAYPYGRYFHFSKEAYDMVFDTGYLSCASAERGCHISSKKNLTSDKILILRDQIICDWNISHIMYFIMQNSRKSIPTNNFNCLS